jgi:small subunit ribosomal protein S19
VARAKWKGPFVEQSLLKEKTQTWSRRSKILPHWVGRKFEVHNGKKWIKLSVTEDHVGHKFGEFAQTRIPAVFSKKDNTTRRK